MNLSPEQVISDLSEKIGISDDVKERANELISEYRERTPVSGSPKTLAAGAVYLASFQLDKHMKQEEIADPIGITSAAVGRRFKEIAKALGIEYIPAMGNIKPYLIRKIGERPRLDQERIASEIVEALDEDMDISDAWKTAKKLLDEKISAERARDKISDLGEKIGISDDVKEKAEELISEYGKKEPISGSPATLAAGAVYLASLQLDQPLKQGEVAEPVGVERTALRDRFRKIAETLGIEYTRTVSGLPTIVGGEPPELRPEQMIFDLVEKIGISDDVKQRANELISEYEERAPISGSPKTLAAGAVYLASLQLDEHMKQKELAEPLGITSAAVSKRFKEIAKVLEIDYIPAVSGLPPIVGGEPLEARAQDQVFELGEKVGVSEKVGEKAEELISEYGKKEPISGSPATLAAAAVYLAALQLGQPLKQKEIAEPLSISHAAVGKRFRKIAETLGIDYTHTAYRRPKIRDLENKKV